jgi:hypothetical protein
MMATCSGTPIWFAARPTPGASRIVSSMSSSSRCRLESKLETRFVRSRRIGWSAVRMGRIAMA